MILMRQEANVNSDVLVWARESINLDIDDAAKKINVKVERLRGWEAGDIRPTINQARKMAEVYHRPLAAFFLPERPTTLGFSVPHDFRRLPDEQPREFSHQLIAELRRIQYLRNAAIELEDTPPSKPEDFIGSVRIEQSPSSVAALATEWLSVPIADRESWRTEYDALNAWKVAMENLGILVMHLNRVDVVEMRGIAIAEQVFPLIAVNGKDSPNGRIFTLIHEFVHLMMGATGISNLRVHARSTTYEQRVERFCNSVAGEVLVPTRILLSRDDVRGTSGYVNWSDARIQVLADFFKVSREVIVRRLTIEGRATQAFYRTKRLQYKEEARASKSPPGGPMPMSRRIIRAVGQPFLRIALDAYYRESISSSDLAELLGARLKHLPAVEMLLGGRSTLTGGD